MDFPMEGAIYTCLAVIICWFMFCLFRRIRTRSKDVENDLKEPETDVVSENSQIEQSENVLNEELDRRGKKKQRSKRFALLIPIVLKRPRSEFDAEYTFVIKYRINERGIVVYRPKVKKIVNAPDGAVNAVRLSAIKDE
ncbi:hypothetical protein Tsp_02058 [Trichinella spiralis]|uniref:Uncharacterized protein n=1 Tax=Trichinella spiralis TaxID=6334 RepID=E5SE89_TRISP|nr:hypothetical protein Tsp_02058 [Trichinella spiralis]KRY41745.1 hypothetical protein T01_1954 [Trichinella spiralis]